MKKFTFQRIISGVLLSIGLFCTVQQQQAVAQRRCGTMEHLELLMSRDPSLKSRMQADEEKLNQLMLQKIIERKNNPAARLNAIVTIPVVVHVILPDPFLVTDADINWQINKLNEDFAGMNADSVLAGPFASLFGHSQIQFCLAQQDANGNPTTGIDRVSSTTTFTATTVENIKSDASCGAASWDVNRYFNIWVGSSTDGTLGIATFPNTGLPENQGIAITYEGFGNNPAYTEPAFNLGRTAVHEAGHFFYLRHIWGDGGGCASDFPSIVGLPTFADDTPTQSGPTSGCPSGDQAAGCGSPSPPGKMYQNYMDYTDDACYCMFTLSQVSRMEAALDIFRNDLTISNGCTPASSFANDAALEAILSPAAASCGSSGTGTFCSPLVTPQVIIKNYGSAALTSVTIYAEIDNGTPLPTAWTGNLAPNASATVSLNSFTATTGAHALKIYVSGPNGNTDPRTANDTLTASFTILTPVTGPLSEGFENTTFPPAEWQLQNPNSGSVTWERTTTAAKSGTASARIRFYDYSGGNLHEDLLLLPPIDVTGADSIIFSFDRAYRVYNTSATYADTLAIVISTDCGQTYTEVWKRGGVNLATVAGATTSAYLPAAGDWLKTSIDLKPFAGSSTSLVAGFKAINKYGQNLYIDDVNVQIYKLLGIDASVTKITEPFSRLCVQTATPAAELRNSGKVNLQSATVVFVLDNTPVDSVNWTGNLAPGDYATITATKPLTMATGINHNITAYSRNPNGVNDENKGNDTAMLRVTVHEPVPAPVTESFESGFPPDNWSVESSGGNYTWEKTNRAATAENASAWIRNYRFNSAGGHNDLYSPPVEIGVVDSVYVRFDLANATGQYPGSTSLPLDTLEVLLTTDCGQTFRTVYKKWGAALQTTGNPNFPTTFPASDTVGFVPSAGQWRKEVINVSQHVAANSKFQVVFRVTSNKGNNTFIDNVNISSVVLPARLKQNGYLVSPNPFTHYFEIRHLVPPVGLRGIEVTNMRGQVLFRRHYQGNASNYIRISMAGFSSGMYQVRMIYDDKVVTEKVLKLQ